MGGLNRTSDRLDGPEIEPYARTPAGLVPGRIPMRAGVALSLLLALSQPRSTKAAPPSEVAFGGEVPSLSRVIAIARQNAPTVVVGRAQVATARAGRVGAGIPPVGNPYVELTGERALSGSNRNIGINGTLWLPLEVAGQRGSRLAEADAQIRFQGSALALSRSLAVADAIRAFGMTLVGGERLRVLGELIEVARSEAATNESRYRAGDATAQDARLSQLDLARYSVMLEEARADAAASFADLARVTGIVYDTPPNAPLQAPAITADATIERSPLLSVSRAEAAYHAKSKERWEREAAGPFSLMLIAGTDEFGEPKAGGGLAYAFPVSHRFQGERARAEAERSRALVEERVNRKLLQARVVGLRRELEQVKRALQVIQETAEPAAVAAVQASLEMRRAGKGDLLALLTSRRDLALLRLRRTDLLQREWNLTSDLAAITGASP